MEQPCGSYCLLKKKWFLLATIANFLFLPINWYTQNTCFWSLESCNKYPDKPWSKWKRKCRVINQLYCIQSTRDRELCVYFTWLEFPLMKCPSDCSGGYMVPKVMCSICIEEYSGYNGGYGRYSIISCNACFIKSKSVLQYFGFINSLLPYQI